MEKNVPPFSEDESRFLQLLTMFQIAAMQQMGKSPNPLTNKIERDLQQAKASIDVLEMLERKTQGNLSEIEKEFMEKILFELRMNYVDEVKKASEASEEKSDGEEDGEDTATGEEAKNESGEGSEADSDQDNAGEKPDEPTSG